MSTCPSNIESLQKLLTGATVLAVEAPDEGVEEAICKLRVLQGKNTTVFHLHATDLGWWVGHVLDGDGLYQKVEDALQDMVGHLTSSKMVDYWGVRTLFLPCDDPMNRTIGFRCGVTGKTWEFALSALRGSPYSEVLRTPESRKAFAARIEESGLVPEVEP